MRAPSGWRAEAWSAGSVSEPLRCCWRQSRGGRDMRGECLLLSVLVGIAVVDAGETVKVDVIELDARGHTWPSISPEMVIFCQLPRS